MNVSNGPQQAPLRLIGEVREPHSVDPDTIERLPSYRAALRYAVNHSGLDQDEIAAALDIDASCFSRMLKEPKHENARQRNFPLEKLDLFARITGSLAVHQWLDARMGMEPVPMRETRRQRLERELAELDATTTRRAASAMPRFGRRVA